MTGWICALLLGGCAVVLAQNITDVPLCAQSCLSNSTVVAPACSSLDVKCLCTNSAYVNTLSCCLVTTCNTTDQQKAIEFNIATCAAVNESAPSFVGCSPLGLASSVVLGSASSSPSSQTSLSSVSATSINMSMASSNSLVVTLTGITESLLTSYIGVTPITATFNGAPLLTGSCTKPIFAMATDSMGMLTEFPEIGCAHDQEGCCPFDSHENAVLTKCPADYFTTAGACCPSGWEVYFSAIGGQTPCYTMPSTTFVPQTSPTIPGLTVITEHVFTRKFTLATAPKPSTKFSAGAVAGIAIGATLGILFLITLLLLLLRRRAALAQKIRQSTILPRPTPMSEPFSPVLSPSGLAELSSPHPTAHSTSPLPTTPDMTNEWPMKSSGSPPAYQPRTSMPKPASPPQELPGSMYIHEHHPAFGGGTAGSVIGEGKLREDAGSYVTARNSPPASPPQTGTERSGRSLVVSPLASPKRV